MTRYTISNTHPPPSPLPSRSLETAIDYLPNMDLVFVEAGSVTSIVISDLTVEIRCGGTVQSYWLIQLGRTAQAY
jgi:hypothetical protein